MSVGKIPPHEAQELETCFRAHASYLFGRACVLTCGDQALAHDLVQAAFEAGLALSRSSFAAATSYFCRVSVLS